MKKLFAVAVLAVTLAGCGTTQRITSKPVHAMNFAWGESGGMCCQACADNVLYRNGQPFKWDHCLLWNGIPGTEPCPGTCTAACHIWP